MSKGSKPAGTTTVQQVNPAQVAQQPFLERGWNQALDLFNLYPNKPIANIGDPRLLGGLQDIYNTGVSLDQTLRPQANQFWQTGGSGNIYNSPAYGFFQNLAQGLTGPQGVLNTAGQSAQNYGQAAAGGNLGLSTLGNIAGGQYLNANPYTAQMVQNAIDPVIRNYQTAISPTIDASFENAGRYGGGAMRGAQDTAQQNLVQGIGNISSNIYGTQFANERALQNQAAQGYGQLFNQGQALGISGAGTAANAAYQNLAAQQAGAAGLQGGYQAGNAAALQAANQYPQLADAQYNAARAAIQSGQGLNAWKQQYLDQPWSALERYQGEVGSPLSGTGSTTSPYFQNQLANTIGGISGTLGIANQLGGLGGLGGSGGLFSAGGTLGSQGPLFGTFADSVLAAGGPPLALGTTAGSAAAAGLEGLPLAAAAGGGWIICTELMRQGRMPKRHWAAGSKVFAAYPETGRRGYYVWAIPTVRHLRRRPGSLYSRAIARVFGWRAEDIAARAGVQGARKLLRGRMVTAVLALPCLVLGALSPEQDWTKVYDTGHP